MSRCLSKRMSLLFIMLILFVFYGFLLYLRYYTSVFGIFAVLIGLSNIYKHTPKFTITSLYIFMIFTILNIGFYIFLWISSWTSLGKGLGVLVPDSSFDPKIGYGIALGVDILFTVIAIDLYYKFKREVCAKK